MATVIAHRPTAKEMENAAYAALSTMAARFEQRTPAANTEKGSLVATLIGDYFVAHQRDEQDNKTVIVGGRSGDLFTFRGGGFELRRITESTFTLLRKEASPDPVSLVVLTEYPDAIKLTSEGDATAIEVGDPSKMEKITVSLSGRFERTSLRH